MSKSKRKVTVDSVSGPSDDRKKPSVFERLGPGAVRRYDDSDSDREEFVQRCRNWVNSGSCPYGNKCKFLHGPYTSGSKHKGRREEDGQEDLRLRVKPRKHKGDTKSDSEDSQEQSRSRAKREKIAALKSAIIRKKGGVGSDSESPSQWSGDDLDFKKELELERRRQQLQRELSQLDSDEELLRENFKIEKKLLRQQVSSSDSDSSDERTHRGKKAGKKKKKRNKHSRSPTKAKVLRSPSPGYDSDEPHKKHKKKSKNKKHRDSFSDYERSPEPESKGSRKLLSPLKFKKSTKAVISKTINAFHSDDDDDDAPPPAPKMNLPMPSRSPVRMIPNLPVLPRSRSSSSEPEQRIEKPKGKRSITPNKKKKSERKVSPEYVKETKVEKVKVSKRRTRSRSQSLERSMSFSPDGKKTKKLEKLEKKKKQKREEIIERVKDTSFERSRPREVRDRDLTPMSDYRDNSPGQDIVKKKKDKKKEKKKKEREISLEREDDRKHKKEKLRERERSESPVATKKPDKRSLDRTSRRDLVEARQRSPSSSKGSRDTFQDRRARSPEPVPRGERDRDIRDPRERDVREQREPRDRDGREGREPRVESRDRGEARGVRDARPDGRELRDTRDPREVRDPRDREMRDRDSRDPRERDLRDRDPREMRDPRDMRDTRDPRDESRDIRDPRDRGDRELRDRPGSGREFDTRDSRDPRDPSGDRRDRYPDDRYRDESGRDRYEDSRYPPPPPQAGGYDGRARYGRERDFQDTGERGAYSRPDRDPVDRRDPGDRREPMDVPFERYGPNRGDPRYGDNSMRGRGPYDYRDQGWERGRGRGRGGWGRGGPSDRGSRYEDRSRRGDWENQRRPDDNYNQDRRDWQDRRDENRRDDRRDGPRDESREKRDDKVDIDKDKDTSKDKDSVKEDKRTAKDEKKDDRKEDRERRDDRTEKDDYKRRDQDLSDVEKKDRRKDDERSREPKDKDKKERTKDKEQTDTSSKDSSGDRKKEVERKKEDESSDRERERSRKRRASTEGSRSPSTKKPRDGSPALSTHSKRSTRDLVKDKEPEIETRSEKGSVAGSERSKKAESEKSRNRKNRKEEEKKSRKGSDAGSIDRKRSRSLSRDGSNSGDNKRRKIDYQEGVGQLAGYVITDTVGSDREDNNMENIEQNFSDWSDDSADDILNRPGETSPKKESQPAGQERSQSPHGSVCSKHSEKAKVKDEVDEVDKETKKSADGEETGELESISSDEGSLVEHVKMAAVDALEIDWASMVKDDRPKLVTGAALKRFKPGALFAQMGISRQFAGEELYKEILDVCQKHQEEEFAIENESISQQSKQSVEDTKSDKNIHKEPKDSKTTNKPKFEFLHDVAMFHSSGLQKLKERRELLSNIGPFRRALCARRDLEIRRQLCKVDKVLDPSQLYTNQDMDSDLYKLSIQMLKQTKDPLIKLDLPEVSEGHCGSSVEQDTQNINVEVSCA